jgi:hypothetical protein
MTAAALVTAVEELKLGAPWAKPLAEGKATVAAERVRAWRRLPPRQRRRGLRPADRNPSLTGVPAPSSCRTAGTSGRRAAGACDPARLSARRVKKAR